MPASRTFAPFLFDAFAFVVRHRCKELLERGVACVLPVELNRMARHQSRIDPFRVFRLIRKQDVQGRNLLPRAPVQARVEQDISVRIRPPMSRHQAPVRGVNGTADATFG